MIYSTGKKKQSLFLAQSPALPGSPSPGAEFCVLVSSSSIEQNFGEQSQQKGGPRSRSELRFGALDGDPPRYSTKLFRHLLQLHGQVQVDHLENWGGEGEGAHDAVIAQSQRASSHIRRHLDSLLVGNGLGMVFGFGRA